MADYDLPAGFTLDSQQGGASFNQPQSVGELPAGFTQDQPQPQGSMPSQVGAALFQGLRTPIDSGAVMLARGLHAIAPPGSSMEKWASDQIQSAQEANDKSESEYSRITGNTPMAQALRFGGGLASMLPLGLAAPELGSAGLAGRMAGGAAIGGASGALTPVDTGSANYWGDVAKNSLIGMGLGGASPILFGAASRIISPQSQSRVAPLLDQGVTPTIGQTAGGTVNRLEQAAMSIPIAGDIIRNARTRAVAQFRQGAINDALDPIGESLTPGTTGRDAIQEMQDKASAAYGKLLPGLTASVDQKFGNDVVQLAGMARFLPGQRAQQFQDFLTNEVLSKFSPAGMMSGETFKDVESKLGQEARSYMHASDPDQRKYGSAVLQLQALMRDMLTRSNPAEAQQLAANNLTWAKMLRVQRAASYTGAEEGNFSPSQLFSSIKSQTPESQFAAGKGLMQPYAEAGKKVLGNTLPDSGTPYRGLLPALAIMGAEHPEALLYGAGAGLGAAGLYSRPSQWLLNRAIASRPGFAGPVGQAINALTPYGAAVAPGAFGSLAP